MTKRLARANITSVMNDERRKQTEQKLIRSGRAEFLEKGYAKANLRDICKAVGVTTGAFYFSFENKEALLAAILEPVIADYQRICSVFAKREEDDPGTKDLRARSTCRCNQHLPAIFPNLWEAVPMRNLLGFLFP